MLSEIRVLFSFANKAKAEMSKEVTINETQATMFDFACWTNELYQEYFCVLVQCFSVCFLIALVIWNDLKLIEGLIADKSLKVKCVSNSILCQ